MKKYAINQKNLILLCLSFFIFTLSSCAGKNKQTSTVKELKPSGVQEAIKNESKLDPKVDSKSDPKSDQKVELEISKPIEPKSQVIVTQEMDLKLKNKNGKINAPVPVKEITSGASQTHPTPLNAVEKKEEALVPATTPSQVRVNTHLTPVEKKEEQILPLSNKKSSMRAVVHEVSASKALGWLRNGNIRFVKGYIRKDGQSPKERGLLVNNQKPHAIVFTTSDSRVPPELIFDQKLGEIFVIRNLDLQVDASVMKSIEFALRDLGTNLVVVLGHKPTEIKDAIALTGAQDAKSQILKTSKWISDISASGEVQIDAAFYDLESGRVEWGL